MRHHSRMQAPGSPQDLRKGVRGSAGVDDKTKRTSPAGDGLFAYTSSASAGGVRAVGIPVLNERVNTSKLAVRQRYRLVAATLITLLYLVALCVLVYLSTGHASLGLTAQRAADGKWVVSYIVPSGLSYDAHVTVGDVVITATTRENQPFDLLAGSGSIDLSDVKSIGVWHPESRTSSEVTTVNRDGSNSVQRWAYAVLGLIFIGVGGPVYVKARQRPAASAFYAFCIFTALALALAPVAYLAYGWAVALLFVDMVLWATSFLFFFSRFPVELTPSRIGRLAFVGTFHVIAAALLTAYAWTIAGHASDYGWVVSFDGVYIAGCVVTGLFLLGRAWVVQRSPEARQQTAILVGGTLFALAPILFLSLIPTILSHDYLVSYQVTALALGIMPLSFAYAITQHQLLGVRGFMRRSVIYVVLGITVLLVFSFVAAALSAVLHGNWATSEVGIIAFGLFVFLIAVSFRYVQQRVEQLVDKFIYHDAYDYKEALLNFSAQLAAEQNLHVLAHQLVERTCRMMNLSCGILLLTVKPDEGAGLNWMRNPFSYDTSSQGGDGAQAGRTLGLDWRRTGSLARPNAAGGHGLASGALRSGDSNPLQALPGSDNSQESHLTPHLMAYAKFGENADAFLEALSAELLRLGIGVGESEAPMNLFFVDTQSDHEGGSHDAAESIHGAQTHSSEAGATSGPAAHHQNAERHHHKPRTTLTTAHLRLSDLDGVQSFLGVPLWTRSRFVGVLCLGGKRTGERFTKDDLSLISTLGGQAALSIYNAQLYEMREQALLDTIAALAYAIEAKDTYTINHCEKITGRAVALAQALALSRPEVENIRLGSILHDVGKIGIPDAILNKPAKLTAQEYEVIKQHAAIGARIVQSVGALHGVVPIIRHHQEWYDGSGYPDGFAGDQIPIGARIIAVVDAYGAMTEDRVYRKAPGHDAAIAELKRWAGKQFDPLVTSTFIRLLRDQPELAEPSDPSLRTYH